MFGANVPGGTISPVMRKGLLRLLARAGFASSDMLFLLGAVTEHRRNGRRNCSRGGAGIVLKPVPDHRALPEMSYEEA